MSLPVAAKRPGKSSKKLSTNLIAEKKKITDQLKIFNFGVHNKMLILPKKSLFLFTSESRFRQFCVYTVYSKYFDQFLIICIIVNSINISFNDYSFREKSTDPESAN